MFTFVFDVSQATYQLMKYELNFLHLTQQNIQCNIIGIYRSSINSNTNNFLFDLISLIDYSKICIIVGDFNLCQRKDVNNIIITTLLNKGFKNCVNFPTHVHGGRIDHAYLFLPTEYAFVNVSFDLFSPYYSDHYAISISIK